MTSMARDPDVVPNAKRRDSQPSVGARQQVQQRRHSEKSPSPSSKKVSRFQRFRNSISRRRKSAPSGAASAVDEAAAAVVNEPEPIAEYLNIGKRNSKPRGNFIDVGR